MRSVNGGAGVDAQVSAPAPRAPWLTGLGLAVPVMLGYLPVAFAFGVLGNTVGLPGWATIAMSLFVYAGSSQFAALQLITVAAAPYAIVLTTLVVNLRHMLLAASVAPNLAAYKRKELALFAFQLTDEAYAVHSAQYATGRERPKREVFTFNMAVHASWVLGTALGVFASGLISDVKAFGLDFALAAMFIALLATDLVKDKRTFVVAVLGGGLAVAFTIVGFGYWAVLVATAVAATIGAVFEERLNR